MNKTIRIFKRIFLSGILASIALTLFCCLYYNVPTHDKSKDGATDYVWESNKNYSSMIEGYGLGTTNNEGYMNTFDYEEGMNIDVLIMGSSHLQGLQIDIKDNCSTLLNEMLGETVYNISVAGHNFKTCLSNLDAALAKYNPNIVVIETSSISLTNNEVDSIINGTISEIKSNENPIVRILQKNQLLRLLYNQFENFTNNNNNSASNDIEEVDNNSISLLLDYIEEICKKYNTKPIIIYHPTVTVSDDGLVVNSDNKSNEFSQLCKENNINYIDMSQKYIEEYNKDFILPTGFNNTEVAKGHINKYAHRMFAEELYKVIKEIE